MIKGSFTQIISFNTNGMVYGDYKTEHWLVATLASDFWESKKDDLYAGIGLFYEYEKWNPSV